MNKICDQVKKEKYEKEVKFIKIVEKYSESYILYCISFSKDTFFVL